jgi:RNA polymerase subunit RPABC4/transcription elongation factor Spt4
MHLVSCIACKKNVEDNLYVCPHCGTLGPNRVMLVPCRNCGNSIGKNANKCPICKITTPDKNRLIRKYICWVLFISWILYASNIGDPHSEIIRNNISLGDIILIIFWIIPFYLIYTDLKDYSGVTKYFSLAWKAQKPYVFATCLKCLTLIHNKTETCPNCGKCLPKDI